MILVVGATGLLGQEICRRLRERGVPVRALVRPTANPERLNSLREIGVELFGGDLKNIDSVSAACHDVHTVVNAASSVFSRQAGDSVGSVDWDGSLSLVRFARVLGVDRFVYITVPHELHCDCELFKAKNDVIRELKYHAMPYTILSTNYFMEVWLSNTCEFDVMNGKVTIFGAGTAPVAWVSRNDVAEIAVRSLDSAAALNQDLNVGGPENLSPLEVVRIFEQVSGQRYSVTHVPESRLEADFRAAKDPSERAIAAFKLEYARGCPMDMSETLRRIPVELTSVRTYASRLLAPKTATA